MIKKWTIAAIVYLAVVIAGYGVYSAVAEPDTPAEHEQMDMGN